MMKEYYQIYDTNMQKTNIKIERPNHVPEGYLFGIVDIVTYNKRNNSYLITKRDKNKRTLPSMLECTCGAMQYNEEPLYSAKRELKEETGITPLKLELFKSYIYRHALANIFVAVCDIDPDSIVLQEGETEAYYWYDEEDFRQIWKSLFVSEIQKGRIEPNIDSIISMIKEML